MGCGKIGTAVSKRLTTTLDNIEISEPFTEWMPAMGLEKVDFILRRRSVSTTGTSGTPDMKFRLAYQVAEVRTDNALAWAPVHVSNFLYTGPGEDCTGVITSIPTLAAGNFFIRFGISYFLDQNDPTSGQADVSLLPSYRSCGSVVGAMTQELHCYYTTDVSYVAVTGWLPAIDVTKVRAAFAIADLAGNFQCRLVYRTATVDTTAPSAWSNFSGQSDPFLTSSQQVCTDDLTLSITSVMDVQFGLEYSQSTAVSTTVGQATVSVAIATAS